MSWLQHDRALSPETVTRIDAIGRMLGQTPQPSRQAIAETLNLTKNQVCGIINRHIQEHVTPIRPFTEPERAQIQELFARGGGLTSAAKMLGVTTVQLGKMAAISAPIRTMPAAVPQTRHRPKSDRPTRFRPAVPGPAGAPQAAPAPRPASSPRPPPQPVRAPGFGRSEGCQWPARGDAPLGNGRAVEFCGEPRAPNRPYCRKHAARAYERRSRGEAEAA